MCIAVDVAQHIRARAFLITSCSNELQVIHFSQWVSGGARTVDEMAHLNEQVIYISESDYQRIVDERAKRVSTRSN